MTENTPRWVAGLSNGETLTEGKGICEADKELSAWAKLQKHLKDNNLTITSFSIRVGDNHFNLPSNTPKFGGLVPLAYNCFRTWSGDVLGSGDRVEEYICAEAIYENYKVQQWVNLRDSSKSWINTI